MYVITVSMNNYDLLCITLRGFDMMLYYVSYIYMPYICQLPLSIGNYDLVVAEEDFEDNSC